MTEQASPETRYEFDRDTTCVPRPDEPGVLDTVQSARVPRRRTRA